MKQIILLSVVALGCHFFTMTKTKTTVEKPCTITKIDTAKTKGLKLYKEARLSSLKKYPVSFVSTLTDEEGRPLNVWTSKMQGTKTFVATTTKGAVAGYLQYRQCEKTKMKHVAMIQHIFGATRLVLADLLSMAEAVLKAEGVEILLWRIADSNIFYKEEALRNNFLLIATMDNGLKNADGTYDKYLTYSKLVKNGSGAVESAV